MSLHSLRDLLHKQPTHGENPKKIAVPIQDTIDFGLDNSSISPAEARAKELKSLVVLLCV
jgi:hypothetical protein